MTPHPDPADEKRALRDRILAVRSALPPERRAAASRAIAARLAATPAWQAARTVVLHASLGAEVGTEDLVRVAEESGKRVAWPRLSAEGREMDLAACSAAELLPGPARALQPPPDAPRVPLSEVDVVVVPGVAFDASGGRLGRGRGHYDATLARLPASTWKVGLAFDAQLVDEVPAEPHDAPLDAVVTETRLLRRGPAGG